MTFSNDEREREREREATQVTIWSPFLPEEHNGKQAWSNHSKDPVQRGFKKIDPGENGN